MKTLPLCSNQEDRKKNARDSNEHLLLTRSRMCVYGRLISDGRVEDGWMIETHDRTSSKCPSASDWVKEKTGMIESERQSARERWCGDDEFQRDIWRWVSKRGPCRQHFASNIVMFRLEKRLKFISLESINHHYHSASKLFLFSTAYRWCRAPPGAR